MTGDGRHLDRDGLLEYFEAGAPAIIPIAGEPPLALVIEPAAHRLALRGPYDDTELPEISHYRHLALSAGTSGGAEWMEFSASGEHVLEAYPVLCSVADRTQLDQMSMGAAIREVLRSYHEMLRSLGRLTDDQELGLVAELIVLGHLIEAKGGALALAAWRAPLVEEHDFGLETLDIEVKATRSETRAHRISSLTQLVPNPGRDLWLVSVQLTAGGLAGRTLSDRIHDLDEMLTSTELRMQFYSALDSIGWTQSQSGLYNRRFAVRGTINTYRVDAAFPSILPTHLQTAGVPLDRIRSLAYTVVLDGLEPQAPPVPLAGIGDRP